MILPTENQIETIKECEDVSKAIDLLLNLIEELNKPVDHYKIFTETIEDMNNHKYAHTFEVVKEYMRESIEDFVSDNTQFACRGLSEVTKKFTFEDKLYEICVEIDWNRYDKRFYYIDGSSIIYCKELDKYL